MTQEQYRETFRQLKEEYPEAKSISVDYYGSGDSFDEYHNVQIDEEYNNNFNINKYENLLDAALEHSEADFDNDGCNGTITIDLMDETVSVDNYYKVIESHPSGLIEFDADSIETGTNESLKDGIFK